MLIHHQKTKPCLCLGTAQFGFAYGVTNKAGQVIESEVRRLLTKASSYQIKYIDGAQAYGNSEIILEQTLSPSHPFKPISKLAAQSNSYFTKDDIARWDQSFKLTLKRLRVSSLEALLLHSSSDLRKPGSRLLENWLLELRNHGFVRRLGLSIYSSDELDNVNPQLLDLVQLPLSLYDQRLLQDGTVGYLRSLGSAIHARSLYLQGLLLTPSSLWPTWMSDQVRAQHERLEDLASERRFRLIDFALGFAKEQAELEAVVVGVCSVLEFDDLFRTWNSPSPWCQDEWRSWAINANSSLDPRRWPR